MPHEFKLAESISHQLRRAEQLASDRFAKIVGENSLTLRQFEVLAAVHERSGLSQSDLVDATGIDRSTLADMMNRMEKRGWVARSQSEKDARANAVSLTPLGLKIFESAAPQAKVADTAILDALSKPKVEAFQNALRKLMKEADKQNAAALRKAARAEKKRLKAEKAEAKASALQNGSALKKRKKKEQLGADQSR